MTSPTDSVETALALPSDEDGQTMPSPRSADRAASEDVPALKITDDLTADFPVSAAELEAIETYLADVLDMVLSGDKDAPSALHCHKRMR